MSWITTKTKYIIFPGSDAQENILLKVGYLVSKWSLLSDIVIEKSIEEYTAVMYEYFLAFN